VPQCLVAGDVSRQYRCRVLDLCSADVQTVRQFLLLYVHWNAKCFYHVRVEISSHFLSLMLHCGRRCNHLITVVSWTSCSYFIVSGSNIYGVAAAVFSRPVGYKESELWATKYMNCAVSQAKISHITVEVELRWDGIPYKNFPCQWKKIANRPTYAKVMIKIKSCFFSKIEYIYFYIYTILLKVPCMSL